MALLMDDNKESVYLYYYKKYCVFLFSHKELAFNSRVKQCVYWMFIVDTAIALLRNLCFEFHIIMNPWLFILFR